MQIIKKRLIPMAQQPLSRELIQVFYSLYANQMLSSAALTGGASATVTTGAAYNAVVNGVLVSKATAASLAALNGPTIQNTGSTCQAWIFTMDSAGTFFTLPGVPATTIAGIQLPTVYEINPTSGLPQIVVGMLTINNASVGAFVPATTLLNVANLNVIFNNTVGPFFAVQQM